MDLIGLGGLVFFFTCFLNLGGLNEIGMARVSELTILTQADTKSLKGVFCIGLSLRGSSKFLFISYQRVVGFLLGGRDQLMANRSSQTVTMYCTSQGFRHLWITIYGLIGGDVKGVDKVSEGSSSHNDHSHILYKKTM